MSLAAVDEEVLEELGVHSKWRLLVGESAHRIR